MTRTLNPIRFGINPRGVPFPDLLAQVRAAEEAGFDTVAFNDSPQEGDPEAWTIASVVGALTKKLILTHGTLNVPYRNPALVAKMAATLDSITGGRVELTLGAGGVRSQPHYQAYGTRYGTPGERFNDLRDAVTIMRGLWTGEPFSHQGRRFHVDAAMARPGPAGSTIPIIIGAAGPRMLRYAGAVADGWIKSRGWPSTMEELQGLIRQLDEGAVEAGRDPRTLRRVLNGSGAIGDGAATAGQVGLVGTPERILATVHEYAGAGIDTFHLFFRGPDVLEQIRQFGQEVIAPLSRG
jgi:alkanesulfonate monooxygenase SsuD/methylene tetrahydromethanopterin reductase-like flavin-dependent oxidoreductase (luciferase family)